jgi:hypothetical protein
MLTCSNNTRHADCKKRVMTIIAIYVIALIVLNWILRQNNSTTPLFARGLKDSGRSSYCNTHPISETIKIWDHKWTFLYFDTTLHAIAPSSEDKKVKDLISAELQISWKRQ